MNKELYETLEMCLQALETGSDLESVLKRFPETANDLRPLLEVSQQARLLAISEVPATALRRGKARVLKYATRTRTSGFKSRKRWLLFAFPRLAISLAAALIFFLASGTGLVRASNGALPGDNLYPVKRTWEDVRLLLVFNPEGRETLQSEFEQERLQEVDKLMVEKRHVTISFAGVVTEQNENVWVVSGVSVHITAASHLPQEPVTAGATVRVTGWTTTQGFVEAESVEILMPGLVLPTLAPTETEGQQEDTLDHGGPAVGQGNNPGEVESSSDEHHSTGVSGDNENSSDSDSTNSNDSGSSYDESHKDKDRSGSGGGSEEQHNDGSSRGEHNENGSGNHD
jgi:Domain of unknown function (DUF5667)